MYIFAYPPAFLVLGLSRLSFTAASFDAAQMVMQWSEDGEPNAEPVVLNTPRVAIIGAGITGASSAHYLHQLTRLHQPLDITVFEADDQVGGRIRSAHVFGEPAFDVEVGGAAFTEDDWCLKDAMQELGLKRALRLDGDHTGVWDGKNLLVSYSDEDKPLTRAFWQSLKWRWRYGWSLTKIHDMIKGITARFSSFAMFHPFLNLPERLHESFSTQEVSSHTNTFLESCPVSAKLINEVIRAESRYRHARDLDQVTVLSSLLVLRSAPDLAIYGGNRRLPHRMLKIAEAHIQLNACVTQITLGEQRRWKIHVESTDEHAKAQCSSSEAEFDIIIITASFTSSGIHIDPSISASISTTEVRPYIERHVTLFSTLQQLSPKYFNLSTNDTVPKRIFTAPAQPASGDGNDIFSITVAARFPPADTGDCEDELEYVYKIISSKPVPDEEIAQLLGHTLDGSTENSSEDRMLEDLGVTWLHRQAWPHAYPHFNPQGPVPDNIEIGPDLYYTAAAEEVLSTMEMSCRMGNNVAKQLFDSKWLGDPVP